MKYINLLDISKIKKKGGPIDEFTQEEKTANKAFIAALNIKTSIENQRLYHRLWKRLADI